jgi:hypothetical protein
VVRHACDNSSLLRVAVTPSHVKHVGVWVDRLAEILLSRIGQSGADPRASGVEGLHAHWLGDGIGPVCMTRDCSQPGRSTFTGQSGTLIGAFGVQAGFARDLAPIAGLVVFCQGR